MATINIKKITTGFGEDVVKWQRLCTVGGNVMIQQVWKTAQKIKIAIWSSNYISGYTSKKIESRISKRDLHTHVNSSTIYNSQEVECPAMDMNKQNVHPVAKKDYPHSPS